MGYKLAGYNVLGCLDIDPKMIQVYKANHNPKYAFLEGIQTFKLRKDLPKDLYDLDILDGSPPCTTFSLMGDREDTWGVEKKFREGQSKQVLDDLFFDFIDLAEELQPKVVLAENVEGLIQGNAKQYVIKIHKSFEKAGYYSTHFLIDGSTMGLPQRRRRVFFVALRKDLLNKVPGNATDMFNKTPLLNVKFKEKKVPFSEIKVSNYDNSENMVSGRILECLLGAFFGETDLRYSYNRTHGKKSLYAYKLIYEDTIPTTLLAGNSCAIVFDEKRYFNFPEILSIGSWPTDYNFLTNKPIYIIGMSVPPLMVANLGKIIYDQWLSKIN